MSLTEGSSVDDVYEWLVSQGISSETCKVIKGKIFLSH